MIALTGLVAGALATGLMRALARRLRWVAAPNPIVPQHRTPTALLGGVGIVIGALAAGALGGVPGDRETWVLVAPGLALLGLFVAWGWLSRRSASGSSGSRRAAG